MSTPEIIVQCIIDASLTNWNIIASQCIAPMLSYLHKNHQAGTQPRFRLAFIVYAAPDTRPSPLLVSTYFTTYDQVAKSVKECLEGDKLGIGRTPAGGRLKMAVLEAIIAGLETFDLLALESASLTPPICHLFLISSALPDSSTKPMWNKSSAFDNVTWDGLPEEFRNRKIHFSAILLRASPKISELHAALNTSLETPPFPVSPSIKLLLSGFGSGPRNNPPSNPNKRPAERVLDPVPAPENGRPKQEGVSRAATFPILPNGLNAFSGLTLDQQAGIIGSLEDNLNNLAQQANSLQAEQRTQEALRMFKDLEGKRAMLQPLRTAYMAAQRAEALALTDPGRNPAKQMGFLDASKLQTDTSAAARSLGQLPAERRPPAMPATVPNTAPAPPVVPPGMQSAGPPRPESSVLWQGFLLFGSGAGSQRKEWTTYVTARSNSTELGVEYWQPRLTVLPARIGIAIPDIQAWVRKTQPALCGFTWHNPNPANPDQLKGNETAFMFLHRNMTEKKMMAGVRLEIPGGPNRAGMVLFSLPLQAGQPPTIAAAVFAKSDVPDLPPTPPLHQQNQLATFQLLMQRQQSLVAQGTAPGSLNPQVGLGLQQYKSSSSQPLTPGTDIPNNASGTSNNFIPNQFLAPGNPLEQLGQTMPLQGQPRHQQQQLGQPGQPQIQPGGQTFDMLQAMMQRSTTGGM